MSELSMREEFSFSITDLSDVLGELTVQPLHRHITHLPLMMKISQDYFLDAFRTWPLGEHERPYTDAAPKEEVAEDKPTHYFLGDIPLLRK